MAHHITSTAFSFTVISKYIVSNEKLQVSE